MAACVWQRSRFKRKQFEELTGKPVQLFARRDWGGLFTQNEIMRGEQRFTQKLEAKLISSQTLINFHEDVIVILKSVPQGSMVGPPLLDC